METNCTLDVHAFIKKVLDGMQSDINWAYGESNKRLIEDRSHGTFMKLEGRLHAMRSFLAAVTPPLEITPPTAPTAPTQQTTAEQ